MMNANCNIHEDVWVSQNEFQLICLKFDIAKKSKVLTSFHRKLSRSETSNKVMFRMIMVMDLI